MNAVFAEKKTDRPVVKIVYSKNGNSGLKEAYRLLARKVLEVKKCKQQSMSELARMTRRGMASLSQNKGKLAAPGLLAWVPRQLESLLTRVYPVASWIGPDSLL